MGFCRRLLFAVAPIVVLSLVPALTSFSATENPGKDVSLSPVSGITVNEVANLIRVPLIRQYNSYGCGVAALQSIFGYYGQDYRGDKLSKALGTTSGNGTDYKNMVRVAEKEGYTVQTYAGMTVDQLKVFIDAKTPVLLVIQAWATQPVDWANDWKDGHYVVAVGYDNDNFYFMDPATVGNYTYIPVAELPSRWHDKDQRRKELYQFGIVIDGKTPAYDPEQIKQME